ncbi:helix-turn-helix domain-containing protein [[Kitasatospora] papulosa]|uniref:helix-turn-helix domain-containing protein n=1 Tax=[Kitasatospora] papulosa TaxID=1464011 RepID=UPI00368FAD35
MTNKRPRLTDAERESTGAELKEKYIAGATIRELVAETGLKYGTVRTLLLAAKTPLRARGGRYPRAAAVPVDAAAPAAGRSEDAGL